MNSTETAGAHTGSLIMILLLLLLAIGFLFDLLLGLILLVTFLMAGGVYYLIISRPVKTESVVQTLDGFLQEPPEEVESDVAQMEEKEDEEESVSILQRIGRWVLRHHD